MTERINLIGLARALIRCPSVTPSDAGALDILERALESLGFVCRRLRFAEPGSEPVDNLYARRGAEAPNFCFAGHTDVVPAGDESAWSHPPFAAALADRAIYGRGAADMKGAIAAFASAVEIFVAGGGGKRGSISLLITGDEEGPAINGTRKVLEWMAERGETIDACVVGEPTSAEIAGDTIKIGRRGSLTCTVEIEGTQGHVAYPHLADNPAARLARAMAALADLRLDDGTENFPPSNLEITTLDVGNPAPNVVPGRARAAFAVRFNDLHTGESLAARLRETLEAAGGAGLRYRLDCRVSGEAFLAPPGGLRDLAADAAEAATGRRPAFSTAGGTSDARFIKDVCPVVELGLPGPTMHKIDERAATADLHRLTAIYHSMLMHYFPP